VPQERKISIVDLDKPITRREFDTSTQHHAEIHQLEERTRQISADMTSESLKKSDSSMERRLEGMNEFRAQLEKQAGDFVTREVFENYTKEQSEKTSTALASSNDKYDTIIKAIVNRQDSDSDLLRDEITSVKAGLSKEIQNEREVRKTFEGSINTWKWIATFLGASGLAGVLYTLATRST
jgi:hypothetical protein